MNSTAPAPDDAPEQGRGLRVAFSRAGPVVALAVVPAVVVATMFVVAVTNGPLAWDFQNELYPQAKELREGDNPYPEALWPPLAAVVAMPFTVLSIDAAGVAFAIVGLASLGLALWLVGVRDWRVYGVVALWPPVLTDVRIAHLTPLLCLLAAIVWRCRDRPGASGIALGLAGGLKLFLWPLGVWLVATGRVRAALLAALVALASVLLVLPFASPADYLSTLRGVTSAFDQDSYSTFGLLTRLDAGDPTARAATFALGAALLALTWRRRSFALAIAAALVLSPIVWLDFYALAAVSLAIARPTLSPVWFLPLLTWGLPSSAIAVGEIRGVARVLVVFGVVLAVAARDEPRATPDRRAAVRPARGERAGSGSELSLPLR